MTDHPMIFSAEMIRALLDGRKTQTRRLLKPQPQSVADKIDAAMKWRIGDRIWVKEAWNTFTFSEDGECFWPTDTIPTLEEMRDIQAEAYRYDAQVVYRESDRARKWFTDATWRSPMFMPKWASRLTLIVTKVRVQRVQDINGEDALAEGICNADGHQLVNCYGPECPTDAARLCSEHGCWGLREDFRDLWNSIHGPDAWNRNDWVAALTFNVHKRNIMEMDG